MRGDAPAASHRVALVAVHRDGRRRAFNVSPATFEVVRPCLRSRHAVERRPGRFERLHEVRWHLEPAGRRRPVHLPQRSFPKVLHGQNLIGREQTVEPNRRSKSGFAVGPILFVPVRFRERRTLEVAGPHQPAWLDPPV